MVMLSRKPAARLSNSMFLVALLGRPGLFMFVFCVNTVNLSWPNNALNNLKNICHVPITTMMDKLQSQLQNYYKPENYD